MDGREVIHNGIAYKCVSAIIYRRGEKGIRVTAELLDKNGPYVVIANAEKIMGVKHD